MISAIVLTHNSEATIQKTLKSLSWCDETIVIDDRSGDRTRDIALDHKAQIFVRALDDDFAAQRNFGLSKAKGEWVLFVDSDEVVTPELRDEIVKELRNPRFAGYYFTRKDFLWGRGLEYGETAHVRLLRLARKDTGRWERPVHEIWRIPEPSGTFGNPLHHYPHPDVAHFLESINRYSTVNARYLYELQTPVSWWHVVGFPAAKFVQNYVVRQGFRDGTPGAIVALMMSFHSFLTRAKVWQLRMR